MKTFYVTKWCLTQGVFEIKGTVDEEGTYVRQALTTAERNVGWRVPLFLRIDVDAFENASDAYKRAIQLADAKEKALARQAAKIAELRREWSNKT